VQPSEAVEAGLFLSIISVHRKYSPLPTAPTPTHMLTMLRVTSLQASMTTPTYPAALVGRGVER
jgi:hypothetical protein